MKVGVIDETGALLGQAFRMVNLAHIVYYAGPDGAGQGLVECVKDNVCKAQEVDFFLINSPRLIGFVEEQRKFGFPIFGGGKLDHAFQKEQYAALFLDAAGLERTPTKDSTVELYVGGLFNGERFTYMFSFIPCKTFMEGERGKRVESMGCTLWPYFYPNNLTRQTLFCVKDFLAKFDFHGMFTMGCMLGPYDISVFDISISTRPDVLDCICELLKMDLARALFNIAKGESNIVETSNMYAVSVHVTTPPFPEEGREWKAFSFPAAASRHVWFKNTQYAEQIYKGASHILTITAQDNFVRRAVKRVYRTIGELSVSELGYRYDVGRNVVPKILQLDEWGWV